MKKKAYIHDWKSEAGGYTHEEGYTNYSKCKSCGAVTRYYKHGDFEDMSLAQEEANENWCNYLETISTEH